ncbi:MAG: hypothetical protein QOG20_2693, partial [Pseudonocardiales bacterium]|nr:hypothetical protein [Pseudonocardiales bacterium]
SIRDELATHDIPTDPMRLILDNYLDRLPEQKTEEASRIMRYWAGALPDGRHIRGHPPAHGLGLHARRRAEDHQELIVTRPGADGEDGGSAARIRTWTI